MEDDDTEEEEELDAWLLVLLLLLLLILGCRCCVDPLSRRSIDELRTLLDDDDTLLPELGGSLVLCATLGGDDNMDEDGTDAVFVFLGGVVVF